MKKIKKFLIGFGAGYLLVLSLVTIFQRSLIYFPPSRYVSPEAAHAPKSLHEIDVVTEDALHLKGWYAPATKKRLTLVFFHGNADSLQSVAPLAGPFLEAGYGYLVVEYRGYSGLPGKPSEKGLYADGRAFLKTLINQGVNEKDIVILGHSLGAGVATQMATEFNIRGLILLTPFLSLTEMAHFRFPFLPTSLLTLDRFENAQKIPLLHMPLFIAVSGKDYIVPMEHGKSLFALGNEPKELFFSPESGHNTLFKVDLYPASFQWLAKLETQP